MKLDLDHFFNLHSEIEKVYIKSWILKKNSKTDLLKSKGIPDRGDIETPYDEKDQQTLLIKNSPIVFLCQQLRQYYSVIDGPYAEPFLDETNYKGNIDIQLPLDKKHSLSQLRSNLKKYGLDLVQEYRKIEVVVLKSPS